MPDRQRFCVTVLSLIILGSAAYLGYYIFIDTNRGQIDRFNWLRMCVFFLQHAIALGMLVKLLYYEEHDNVIQWMFELSLVVISTFIGGEVFILLKGGRLFASGSFFFPQTNDIKQQNSLTRQFQLNEITLYYQIMTDFVMFFIVSTIALIVIKCKKLEEEHRYEFMIDNLKSEDFVDEPNVHDKKSCAICLTDLANQRVLKVPCEHIFHKQCLINWLKRSSICPLCRTDIQQSLGPNSPLRAPSNNNIPYPPLRVPNNDENISYPPIIPPVQPAPLSRPHSQRQHQRQQLPELTFSQSRPHSNLNPNTINQRSRNLIGRVNEQVSLGNSRVSLGRVIKERNPFTEGKSVGNKFGPQLQHHRQAERPNLHQNNNKFKNDTPILSSEYTHTPRSIHLPTPLPSQNSLQQNYQNDTKKSCDNSTYPLSQQVMKVQNSQNLKKHPQQIMNPSQQYVPNPLYKKYLNPNQNYVRMPIFGQTHKNQRQLIH